MTIFGLTKMTRSVFFACLLELLHRKLRIPEIAVGNINVLKDRTEFEVHKDSAKKVLMELKGLRAGDKRLRVELVHRELPPISMQ